MKNAPIGIFDSGIGGLTVAKEIEKLLPGESIVYIGDTARVPYGSRDRNTITAFAKRLMDYLLTKDVKCLVIACNTITSVCLAELQELSPVPVLGVIEPAAESIAKTTKTGKIGIIGTHATIHSKSYEKAIKNFNPHITVFAKACPLFVPIAEEGLAGSTIAKLTARYYLEEFKDIDTLHLGCTHYPLLKETIQEVVGENIQIIDSAKPTAQALKMLLEEKNLINDATEPSKHMFYVTDAPQKLYEVAKSFFGEEIKDNIVKIDLG